MKCKKMHENVDKIEAMAHNLSPLEKRKTRNGASIKWFENLKYLGPSKVISVHKA